MSFVSYAQNYEDVMLRRALKDVEQGFYIDVGANDPIVDSVTKTFYDSGWHGINIEPVAEWYKKIQHDRPRDVNLQVAAGARKGRVNFYEVVGTGLSTMGESIAKRHVQEHGFELKRYKVPVVRLTTICEQYVHSDIHFLKIDVEGVERSVLRGLDLTKFRPWIIVVESTLPNSQLENYEEWEHTILGRGYHFVYFDGLNRYYVADEYNELDVAFATPPNFFDHFRRSSEDLLESQLRCLENELETAKASTSQMQEEQFELRVRALEAERHEMEIRQQELLLAAVEKETKLLEVSTALMESKEQHHRFRASIADGEQKKRVLEASLQAAENGRYQLDIRLQSQYGVAQRFRQQVREKKETIDQLADERKVREREVNALQQSNRVSAERHRTDLQEVFDSRSWRITLPLRRLMQLVHWLFRRPSQGAAPQSVESAMPKTGVANSRSSEKTPSVNETSKVTAELSQLTPRARSIHRDLKVAVDEFRSANH